MSSKVNLFLNEYEYDYNSKKHYSKSNNEILIVNNCCSSKDKTPNEIKACERYKGREITLINKLIQDGYKFDHYIISAKYGLIKNDTKIPNYNKTFNSLTKKELNEISDELKIRNDLEKLIKKNGYRMVFILLSENYLNVLNREKPFNVKSKIFTFQLKNKKTINSNNSIVVLLKTDEYIKKFKHYSRICIKTGIIYELFKKYPNYEFIEDNSLIEKFINK